MKLNLLPEENKKKLFGRKLNKFLAAMLSVLFVIILALSFILFGNSISQNTKISNLDKKIKDQEAKNNKFSQIEKEMNEFFDISKKLLEKEKKRTSWNTILEETKKSTPVGLQVSGFTLKENSKLEIRGFSPDIKNALLFKEKLEANERFKLVEMQSTSYSEERGNYDYLINLTLEGTKWMFQKT